MDIGKELRVIEVDELEFELPPVEVEVEDESGRLARAKDETD